MQSLAVPGGVVSEQPLAAPTWSANVSVTYVGKAPSVDLYAYCDANANGKFDQGEECVGSTPLGSASRDGVTFERDDCPGRL